MKTICGIDCTKCQWQESCQGCHETNGRPFGGECVVAQCYKSGKENAYLQFKNHLIEEFNALKIIGMPPLTDLCPLNGAYVNLEYTLLGGQKTKLLDDKQIYLCYQIEKENSDRCYGVVANKDFLLVCEYGCNGLDPEIIVYKKRE